MSFGLFYVELSSNAHYGVAMRTYQMIRLHARKKSKSYSGRGESQIFQRFFKILTRKRFSEVGMD